MLKVFNIIVQTIFLDVFVKHQGIFSLKNNKVFRDKLPSFNQKKIDECTLTKIIICLLVFLYLVCLFNQYLFCLYQCFVTRYLNDISGDHEKVFLTLSDFPQFFSKSLFFPWFFLVIPTQPYYKMTIIFK